MYSWLDIQKQKLIFYTAKLCVLSKIIFPKLTLKTSVSHLNDSPDNLTRYLNSGEIRYSDTTVKNDNFAVNDFVNPQCYDQEKVIDKGPS
jgi:hypothetical protein